MVRGSKKQGANPLVRGKSLPKTTRATATLLALMEETARLYFRMRTVAQEVHQQGSFSAARRSFLRDLHYNGPQTVPQLARSRPVSRQHFQRIATGLAEDSLVEFLENPAHKKSQLVNITEKGKKLVVDMNQRENKVFSKMSAEINTGELEKAKTILLQLRKYFEGSAWQQLVNS